MSDGFGGAPDGLRLGMNSSPQRCGSRLHPRKEAGMAKERWSADVTEHSDALDLAPGVFKLDDPGAIARSLKESAEHSQRRKAEPFRSAMSMLNLYINRAGKNLPAQRRKTLERAKDELRALFGREPKNG
jgi:hypothetical protein